MPKRLIEGTDELRLIAFRLHDAGDRKVTRRVSAALRKVAKPLGEQVLAEGAAQLPHRGGLAEKVGGKVGVRASLAGQKVSVSLLLKANGYDLRPIDKGDLRHPVFGNRRVWVRQRVKANRFTVAFINKSKPVRREVLAAAQGVLDDVARGI